MSYNTDDHKIILLGGGGHAVSCSDLLSALGYTIVAIISPSGCSSAILRGYPCYPEIDYDVLDAPAKFCLAIGSNYVREKVALEILEKHGTSALPSLVHPRAYVSSSAQISHGCVVMAGSIVGANATIDLGGLVNTGASIDHDSKMDSFSSLAPGVCVGGSVAIGRRSAICIGAVVSHGVTIGADAVLGASSLALKDIASCSVSYGVPARYVRSRSPSDLYL
jgi:sugar O-acyltransferase (sialic acid O-acetyltransferase NeuD family)